MSRIKALIAKPAIIYAFVPPVESKLLLESTTEANSSLERKSELCIESKNSSRFRGSRRRRAQLSYIPERPLSSPRRLRPDGGWQADKQSGLTSGLRKDKPRIFLSGCDDFSPSFPQLRGGQGGSEKPQRTGTWTRTRTWTKEEVSSLFINHFLNY